MREVEVKVRVHDKQKLIEKIRELGTELGSPEKQADIIFCTAGSKDYQEGSIWLRIRIENDTKTIFTLKRDNGRRLDSIEHEVGVDNSAEMESILRLMGYEFYTEIIKVRQKVKYGEIELCVDEVEGLGVFAEAEKLVDDQADHGEIINELWLVLEKLGLRREDEVYDSYDVLLRKVNVAA